MLTLATAKVLGLAVMAGLSGLAIFGDLASHPGASEFVSVEVTPGQTISVSRYEVTVAEWKACHADKGCSFLPRTPESGNTPITGVNRFDVDEYLAWINAKSGHSYRLPTADEWNAISNGLSRRKVKKLFDDPRLAWAADYGTVEAVSTKVRPSGSFDSINGIADLAGNVWEWTSTCATANAGDNDCPAYFAEGLHEAEISVFIRDPAIGGCAVGVPPANLGFRLVEDR